MRFMRWAGSIAATCSFEAFVWSSESDAFEGLTIEQEDENWKPPGNHRFYYRMRMELGATPIEMSVVVPNAEEVNLATARVHRIGGPNSSDWKFRQKLYYLIGAAVVKAGQIEASMKRLMILTSGRSHGKFSVVDLNWADLHKTLMSRARNEGPPGNQLLRTLEWGEEHKVKAIRDDFVHSNWWDYSDVGVVSTRFERKADGKTVIGALKDVEKRVNTLGEYEMLLDECVAEYWVSFFLPKTKE